MTAEISLKPFTRTHLAALAKWVRHLRGFQ